jgi:hypothetical protein
VKKRPIIMSGESVKAILAGQKTQTRRVVKSPSGCKNLLLDFNRARVDEGGFFTARGEQYLHVPFCHKEEGWAKEPQDDREMRVFCSYGRVGDRLWVRETFNDDAWDYGHIEYKADYDEGDLIAFEEMGLKWKSPIFMPRWASRITLEITGIRVERLQEIKTEDIIAEGVSSTLRGYDAECDLSDKFIFLWDRLNAKRGYPWLSNPLVWVIEFKPEVK